MGTEEFSESLCRIAQITMPMEELILTSLFKKIITIFSLILVLTAGTFAGNTEAASRVSSAEIVADAKSLIGIKYRYGGTTKAGFDCSGFLGYIYKQNGVSFREQQLVCTALEIR